MVYYALEKMQKPQNQGSKELNDLPKITQLVCARAQIGVQVSTLSYFLFTGLQLPEVTSPLFSF